MIRFIWVFSGAGVVSIISIGFYFNWPWIQWVFSGVGVVAVTFIYQVYNDRKKTPASPTHITQNNSGNTNAPIHTGSGDNIINNTYGISPEYFERLVSELSVTKHVLSGFLEILKEKQVPPEDWEKTLTEIAERHKELIAKLKTLNSEDPEVNKLRNQAEQAIEDGRYDEAEKLLNQAFALDEQAIEQMQENLYKRQVSAAETLAANGQLKETQLAYKAAGEYYEKAATTLPAQEEETLATCLNNAGSAFHDAGHYEQAKPLYERALAIRKKVLGEEHPDVASSLNNLAELLREQGHYEQAKPLYERALAIFEKVYGKEHPLVATGLNNLALLLEAQGHYDQAKPLLERALAIAEKMLGKEHPQTRNHRGNYENLLKKME